MFKVPHMGPAPRSYAVPLKWKSILQLDGTPMEYSWKWNTKTNPPDVRYGSEAIGPYAGTELDPLNQLAAREIMHKLTDAIPSMDITWTHHFLNTLFDHDNAKYAQEAAAGAAMTTSLLVSLEFSPKGLATKTYFQPRKLGQEGFMPVENYEAAFQKLDPDNKARATLHEFLATSPAGKELRPFCLSVDNVVPEKSRLKWYFNSPQTSFDSIRDIMTLGGRVAGKHLETQLAELRALINAVTGLPPDFPENKQIPQAPQQDNTGNFIEMPELLAGNVYFFDIAPGKSLPEMKVYVPVRNFGQDDLALAHGLSEWMEFRGRGEYCERYMDMLQSIADYRHLQDGQGLQTFLSCQFKPDGELDITSYLNPNAFHPARQSPSRPTRRRSGSW